MFSEIEQIEIINNKKQQAMLMDAHGDHEEDAQAAARTFITTYIQQLPLAIDTYRKQTIHTIIMKLLLISRVLLADLNK